MAGLRQYIYISYTGQVPKAGTCLYGYSGSNIPFFYRSWLVRQVFIVGIVVVNNELCRFSDGTSIVSRQCSGCLEDNTRTQLWTWQTLRDNSEARSWRAYLAGLPKPYCSTCLSTKFMVLFFFFFSRVELASLSLFISPTESYISAHVFVKGVP